MYAPFFLAALAASPAPPFRGALRLGAEDRIHVLLVDRDGRVHWRAEGRFDVASGAELVRRTEELRPQVGDAGSAGATVDGHRTAAAPSGGRHPRMHPTPRE